jgi:TetR/AcrR family transcriptional repressor of nem operon
MNRKATRDQIIEAADRLFYQVGYDPTSFADISQAVGIARGNVTFHFPAKDDILNAVVNLRLERTRQMLERWEAESPSPADRIKCYLNILIANRTKIMLHGCPVGTLCTELAKLEHDAKSHASRVFGLFRDWLREQFRQLGFKRDAEALALHVLAWSQGVATLANAFHDEAFIRREVRQLEDWLDTLVADPKRNGPNKRAHLCLSYC